MSSYICVIECSDNHLYIADTRKVQLGYLIPIRIIGLYNVEHNYRYYKTSKKPVSRHLDSLELGHVGILEVDYEVTPTTIVETIISDRHFYGRQGGEWYKVRTGDREQNEWMYSVTEGYKRAKQPEDYFASHRVSHLKPEEVDDRPVCSHGFPCEVHFGKEETYFDCPVKYVWPDFLPGLERIKPCTFKQIV
jgi:hypothetical protein